MLTSLLVLTATAFAVQEAGGAVPTPQDAPEAAPVAPAETAPEVRSFLAEAEKLLYDPQAAGLKSLEFDATVAIPNIGPVGSVHVSWSRDAEPSVAFEKDDEAKLPPGVPAELLTMSGEQFGRDFLDQVLNRPITPLLEDSLATMEAPQDGLVCIDVEREIERQQRIKEHKLLFDEDGLLQKSRLLVDTEGSGMPFSTLPITEVYTWKASAPGNELLVLNVRAGEQDLGMFGKEKTTTTFSYTTVDDMVLLTGMSVDSDRPAMLGGRSQQQFSLRNLVVNGKPSEVTPPPAAPPEAPPPADEPPAGG